MQTSLWRLGVDVLAACYLAREKSAERIAARLFPNSWRRNEHHVVNLFLARQTFASWNLIYSRLRRIDAVQSAA
jgi:hypothetical protein